MDLALRFSPMRPEQFRELIDGPPICPFTGRLLDPGNPGITIAFHPDSQTGAAPMVDYDAETAAVVRYANDEILAALRGAMACRQVSSPGLATTATVRSGSMPRWQRRGSGSLSSRSGSSASASIPATGRSGPCW